MKKCRTCEVSMPFEDCSGETGIFKDYDLKYCICERTMKTKEIDKDRDYCRDYKKRSSIEPKFRNEGQEMLKN